MSVNNGYSQISSKFSCSPAINTLESTLLSSLSHLKDLVLEFDQLHISSENYKTQYKEQKEKCESNRCKSSEALKEVIAAKDQIIQLAASTLTKLDETKNLNIIKEIFKILCGDTTPFSPTKTHVEIKQSTETKQAINKPILDIKKEPESPVYSPEKDFIPNALKDECDVAKEESLLEIEGTPTGRTSPIIQQKKLRSTSNNTTEFREKKKCPKDWPSSETKAIKLLYNVTPTKGTKGRENLRLKQSKLHLVKVKQSNSIDLTSSPKFSGGVRVTNSENLAGVQPLIKKESIESEDTILPSPTSGPTNFSALYISAVKSPSKFKAPLSLSRLKSEKANEEIKVESPKILDATNIEESINLLQPNRRNGLKRQSPVKSPFVDKDMTDCETQKDDSMSLLQHVKILEANQENVGRKSPPASPNKIPLMENKNIMNVPDDVHIESSLSLLSREIKATSEDKAKRKVPDPAEDIYKEPTVRKKAEKRELPGWSCDECKDFFAEVYKDDPEMLAKKMDECSKHRGRKNPARARSPGNFWNPRWDVPEDTEEFNKRNNAK